MIIDASAFNRVFGDSASFAGKVLVESVNNQRRRLVWAESEKLKAELRKYGKARNWLSVALNSGSAYQSCKTCVQEKTQALDDCPALTSDDPHVIALAQITRCRVLCAKDSDLITDFGSPILINNPRGHVYPVEGNLSRNAATSMLDQWTRHCRGAGCQDRPVTQCSHNP